MCVRFLLTGLYQARRRNRGKGNLLRYSQSLPEIYIRHGRGHSFERQTLNAKKQTKKQEYINLVTVMQ